MCPPPATTGPPVADIAQALEPVREALLARARETASQTVAAAREAGTSRVERARSDAAALLEGARAAGRADAEDLLAAEAAAARRRAREVVLRARREACEEVRRRSREAVRDVLAQPGARAAMTSVLRAELPGDVRVHDEPGGGLLIEAPGRRLDASVEALVDAVLAEMDLEELWAGA